MSGAAVGASVLSVVVGSRDVVVDLRVEPGEVLAVIGPNGAGKSTLVGVAAGLVRPDAGDVVIGGRTVVRDGRVVVPVHRRGVGLVGQDPVLFPQRSVLENVAYGPRAGRATRRAAHDRALAALEVVGAVALAHRAPATLSGGQAQRVAVARALATRPRLLLLDEPTSALDVAAQTEVRTALATAVGRDGGREAPPAVLLVTHDPLEAIALADRVVVLEGGRVAEQGPVDQVLRRPTSSFGAAFSGLVLLAGEAVRGGLRLPDGAVVAADVVDAAVGQQALAAYHPAAARILPGVTPGTTSSGTADRPRDAAGGLAVPTGTVLAGVVERLEPRDGLVRVGTATFVVDATVAAVAASGVRVGATVTVGLPAAEVTVFPAGA